MRARAFIIVRKSVRGIVWLGVLLGLAYFVASRTVLYVPEVRVARVGRRDIVAEVFARGTLEAKILVDVGSKIVGKIERLHADQGDRVKAGQLLAQLEKSDLLAQVAVSKAKVETAKANHSLADASHAKAEANLRLARAEHARLARLLKTSVASKSDFDAAENTLRVAEAEVKRAEAERVARERETNSAESTLAFDEARLRDTDILSPMDGIIISRELEVGATVVAGSPIFRMVDPKTLWVKANVDESEIGKVKVGQEARILLRSRPGEALKGRVTRLAWESDRVTEELEVDVIFTPPPTEFHIGQKADVYITVARKDNVLAVPKVALKPVQDGPGVFVVEGEVARFRPIKPGIADRESVEVQDGTAEGDLVVDLQSLGRYVLKDGQTVKTLEPVEGGTKGAPTPK